MTAIAMKCFELDSSLSNSPHSITSYVQHVSDMQSADHELANQQHVSDEAVYQDMDDLRDETCNEPPMQYVIGEEYLFIDNISNSSSLNQQHATDNAKHSAVYFLLLYCRDVVLSHKKASYCVCTLGVFIVIAVCAGLTVGLRARSLAKNNKIFIFTSSSTRTIEAFGRTTKAYGRTAEAFNRTIEAFGVMKTQQQLNITDRLVPFDSVIRNVSKGLDLATSSFTLPSTSASPSLYWMIVGVEVPMHTQAKVRVSNTSLIISKTHSNNSDKDLITKSGLVLLVHGVEVTIQSDNLVLTAYWSGFCLSSTMQSLVVFFVACSKKLAMVGTDFEAVTKITYDTIVINENQIWNIRDNCFQVSRSGFYIFSINVGFELPFNPSAWLTISSKGLRQTIVLGRASSGHVVSGSVDFISGSRVLQLTQGDTVEGGFSRALSIYSDSTTLATSLSAFLYSPVSNVQVVWSVARIENGLFEPPFKDPLPYTEVILNQGDAWSPSQNAAVIRTPGIYYVFVTLDVCHFAPAALWLKVKGIALFEVKSTRSGSSDQSRSNGAVIRLAARDKLTVEMATFNQTCLYGSYHGVNSFFGLLLSPTSV